MKRFLSACLFSVLSNAYAGSEVVAASAPGAVQKVAAPDIPAAFWLTAGLVTLFLLLALRFVKKSLKAHPTWSLADALSEEAEAPSNPADPCKAAMVASASRLIAFMGSIALITVFVGFGYYLLWACFAGRTIPDIGTLTSYLWAGAGMFLPYAANQAKNAIGGIAKN